MTDPINVHYDSAEQHPDVPTERQTCERDDCPGKKPYEEGWECGYGMAGGGMGMYIYCKVCERIVEKTQDPSE